MKRNCIAVLFGTAALITSASALATNDATINFTGKISSTGCTVSVNDSGSSATLDMGTIDMSGLTVGETSDPYAFTISLNNCPSGTKNASLTFVGTASPSYAKYFGLDGTNNSKVGLEIKNTAGGNIVEPNVEDIVNMGLSDGNGKASYTAQLVKLADSVDQTDFDVSTSVDIAYQ